MATWVPRRAAAYGVSQGLKRVLPLPPPVASVPEGRMVDLPGRGRTFVVDVPGPYRDAPTVLLLHALGTTAYLTWFTALGELSRHYRVVTLDLRWHGRGIRSDRFRVTDCADDAAAVLDHLGIDSAVVAGYSLGGAVAQELWHRHPERVGGLVLCSTARRWKVHRGEQVFFPVLGVAMAPLSRAALAGVNRRAEALPETPSIDSADLTRWGFAEWRSTSAWSMPAVLAELGRFDSSSWLGGVDVPAAVVVTERDAAVPAERQRAMAEAIPGCVTYDAPGGHTSLFADSRRWLPVFMEAVASVTGRLPEHRAAG